MYFEGEEEQITYFVAKNHEEQYSIWPDYKPAPVGWQSVGKTGKKKECLDYIKTVWTDMRPKSLRAWEKSGSDTSST